MSDMIVITSEHIAGYKITETLGNVFGQTTRSRNIISDIGQGLKSIVGGEIKGYTRLQYDARQEAVNRMRDTAEQLGAHAIIMFRFDTTSGQLGESVAAYGTAVKIEKL